ncbi:MAG: methyltransferase [Actinomycetota bacterium]|nr:methyltransferase [Actinomycetota bacterium]
MPEYVLDQSWHAERQRLDSMAAYWDPGTLALAQRCGLGHGAAVLEVGAGAGSAARRFAEQVGPTGRVTAVDIDVRLLADLDLPQVEVRQLDLRTDELDRDAYDLVHARMLIEHLADAKEVVLGKLVGALKPGGWLIVEDLDWHGMGATSPRSEILERVLGVILATMSESGVYDPQYGRGLLTVLRGLGLQETSAEYRGVHVFCDPHTGVPPYDLFVAQVAPMFLSAGLLTEADLDALTAQTHDGSSVIASPMMFAALGRRPRQG